MQGGIKEFTNWVQVYKPNHYVGGTLIKKCSVFKFRTGELYSWKWYRSDYGEEIIVFTKATEEDDVLIERYTVREFETLLGKTKYRG